jgi:meiotic recombination protein REC8
MSDPVAFAAHDAQPASQVMRHALDREGQNFLGYVESIAREKGYPDGDENSNGRWWVEFEELFQPEDQKRAVVAQAFHHVLLLATKNVIKVKQDGQGGHEPFGAIHLGVEGLGDTETGAE